MSVYTLLNKANVVGNTPTRATPPNPAINPPGPQNPNMPPQAQAFHLLLDGIGNCSATVQLYASMGGADWVPYLDPVTVNAAAADTTPGQIGFAGGAPWPYFAAIVTAISGTNAAVTCKMSC